MACKTTIIAEIGENHLGNWDVAKQMIVTAADAGAQIVKFQSYFGKDTKPDDADRAFFTQVEVSNEMHFELNALARSKGVRFMSTPFNTERAIFLVEKLRLAEIKVASGIMRNFKILDYLNSQAARVETVYLSTGMYTIDRIRESLSHLNRIKRVVVLHCVASYPLEDADANLRAINTLAREFPDREIGYSDHTIGIEACCAAVAIGATVLEKHYTFNTLMPGGDHLLAMTPQDLAGMVLRLQRIEVMLGTGNKAPTEKERQIMPIMINRFGE